MPYRLKIGDVILVHDHHFASDLVMWGEEIELLRTGEKWPSHRIYSHAAIYVGNALIIEALGHGLTLSPLAKYDGIADIWSTKVQDNDRMQMFTFAMYMYWSNFKYSWWLDILLSLRMLFGLHIRWMQFQRVNCSAFAYDTWNAAGHKIAAHQACSPEDIALYGALNSVGVLDFRTINDEVD